jgi:hypothetical protein
MTFVKRFFALILLLMLPVVVMAQATPTAPSALPAASTSTPIPSSGTGGSSNVPSLPGSNPQPIATLQSNALTTPGPDAEATEAVGAGSGGSLSIPINSQECPALVQESFNTTALACDAVGAGEACIGNGIIEASPRNEDPNFSFDLAGDKTTLASLSELNLQTLATDSNALAVVRGQIILNTTDASAPLPAALLVFGDVSIADSGERSGGGGRNARVLAQNGINVRRTPDTAGVVVWQLTPSENVVAIGRTADQAWIRIIIPNEFAGIGWVYAPYLDVEGGAETLPFATFESAVPALEGPEFGSMQSFSLLSATTNPDCGETPDSGILLQSPDGIPGTSYIKVRINGVQINLNGAAFIQAQAGRELLVSVVEGEAIVNANNASQTVRTGQVATVTMGGNLEPTSAPTVASITDPKIAFLPVSLLPRPFGIQPATTTAAAATPDTGTGIVISAAQPTGAATIECKLTSNDGQPKNLRAAPSIVQDITAILQPDETLTATVQTRDLDGLPYTWYFVGTGYVRNDAVNATEGCTSLPVAEVTVSEPTAQPAAVLPTATTAAPTGPSLVSTEFGQLCGLSPAFTRSYVGTNDGFTTQIGGTLTASAGLKGRFSVEGGLTFRGDFGDFMRLVDPANVDTIIAKSGQTQVMDFTFQQATTFNFLIAANKGDFVIFKIECLP